MTTEKKLVTRLCPICEASSEVEVVLYKSLQFYTDGLDAESKRSDIRTVACTNCRALFMNPCYSEEGFDVLFAEAGESYGSAPGRNLEQTSWLQSRGLLADGYRLLDVGCFDGRFIASLPRGGLRIGVDADESAISSARLLDEESTFINAKFEELDTNSVGNLTLITMFHVIEHVVNPLEVLQTLRSLCDETTRLVLETPTLEGAIPRVGDLNGAFSVQHLTHFTKRSLSYLVHKAGFAIDEWEEAEDYNGARLVLSRQAERFAPSRVTVPASVEELQEEGALLERYLILWEDAVRSVVARATEFNPNCERVVIWGAGMHTELLHQHAGIFWSHREVLLVDGDPKKVGQSWRGIEIQHPSILEELEWSSTQLIISVYGRTNEIYKAGVGLGVPPEKIVRLYDETASY